MQHSKCSTEKHPEVPRWYTSGWSSFVKTVGSENAFAQRKAFHDGFTDDEGIFWCGHCFMQKEMINAGKHLGYPDAHSLYSVPQTRDMAGYDAWMYLASTGGPVLVQLVLRGAQAKLAQMKDVA